MKNLENLNIEKILNLLPHRYPFLLIDRILKIKNNQILYALKNVTYNEHFFQGHFPFKKIFPGVLIVEAIAQSAGVLISKRIKNLTQDKFYYLVGIDKTRFKKFVFPGDQINIKVFLLKDKGNLIKFGGVVKVDEGIVCRSIITCFKYKK